MREAYIRVNECQEGFENVCCVCDFVPSPWPAATMLRWRTVRIRQAVTSDRTQLMLLIQGYFDFYRTPFPGTEKMAALLDELQADERLGVQLVAEEGERLLGFTTLFACLDTLVAGRILVMNDLYVSPVARGKGTGAALLEAAREFAHRRGYLRLDWVTASDNRDAQRFYDRQGAHRGPWISYSLLIAD